MGMTPGTPRTPGMGTGDRVLEEDLKLHVLGVSALALGAQLFQEARPVATDEEKSGRQHDETADDWSS
jgi:hypothetical protein